MPTITASGLGSGLDINGIVSQLVAAEGQPASQRLDLKEAEFQARLSAFGVLKGSVSAFQSSLSSLTSISAFQSSSASSSETDVAEVSISGSAAPGDYELNVTQLAKAHSLVTDGSLGAAKFTSLADVVGTGTLTFKFGATSYDPEIDSYTGFVQNADKPEQSVQITDGSLSGIRDAVNAAGIGVNAAIIFDGTNYRLSFSSADSGAAQSLQIAVTDDDLDPDDAAGLSLLSFNETSNNMLQTQAGQDAGLTLNGIPITSSDNTLTETIDGLTIKLGAEGNSTLSVTQNASGIIANIESFVSSHNSLATTINDLTAYNAEEESSGVLNGDSTLRILENQLRRMLSGSVTGSVTGFSVLADIGITRNSSDGTLVLDSGKLAEAVADDPDAIISLFAAYGRPSDSLVEYSKATDETVPGEYAINITQLATRGDLVASVAANLTITSGSNDSLSMSVDGVETTVTLSAGTYTAAALALEIQSKLNGSDEFSSNDVAVVISESAGVLSVVSNRFGSASSVSATGGNAVTGLFGGSPVVTDGLDVAGTIGGSLATGSGQTLTATGDADGLAIRVTGGVTGDRGSVTFSRGYAEQVDSFLSSVLASDGTLASVTDSLNDSVDEIQDDREALARRLDLIEARLLRQFSALDSLISNLQSTSSFLTSQLAALPIIGSNNNNAQ
jgi:flagellar hook-associated protein 2